ncbi:MAG: hypothetical protein HY233_03905 [Acidobacteriales bacterium]|nr:hypothetical protein [Candidatus Koribacter versatilis]MBI3645092.1 hypothetical protein [Terriglobales bacterium]
MRRLPTWMLLFALTAGPAVAKDETVDELKFRVQNALPQDRPGICVQIAQLQLRNADKLYTDGNVEQARAALDEVVAYSEKARDSARESRKRLKNVEIAVRRMAEKLKDIKRTLAFEDQPPVEHAIQHLEEVRTSLLKEMFKKEKK